MDGFSDHCGISLDMDALAWGGNRTEVEVVRTSSGPVTVTICGDRGKPALVTYHDIGLNHASCFQSLFFDASPPSSSLLHHFCVYHIDAPGHEEDGKEIDGNAPWLTADDLAEQVGEIADYFGLLDVIGMGVGAGAYVLSLFAVKFRSRVNGLILISPYCQSASLVEWMQLKALTNILHYCGMTNYVKESLLQRYFSQEARGLVGPGAAAVQIVRRELGSIPAQNVVRFMHAFAERRDLTDCLSELPCHHLLVVGERATNVDETLHMNQYLDKRNVAWTEIPSCGSLVTEERPSALFSPIEYFLVGLGFCLPPPGLSPSRAQPLVSCSSFSSDRIPSPSNSPSQAFGPPSSYSCNDDPREPHPTDMMAGLAMQQRWEPALSFAEYGMPDHYGGGGIASCPPAVADLCGRPPAYGPGGAGIRMQWGSGLPNGMVGGGGYGGGRSSTPSPPPSLCSSSSISCSSTHSTSSQTPSSPAVSSLCSTVFTPSCGKLQSHFSYEDFSPERMGIKLKPIKTRVERCRSYSRAALSQTAAADTSA